MSRWRLEDWNDIDRIMRKAFEGKYPIPSKYPDWCRHTEGVFVEGGLNCMICKYFVTSDVLRANSIKETRAVERRIEAIH